MKVKIDEAKWRASNQKIAELQVENEQSKEDIARRQVERNYLENKIKQLKDALLELSEILRTKGKIYRPEPLVKPTWICFEQSLHTEMEIVIKQALEA